MAPPISALAQSESKNRFLQRLELRPSDTYHKELYNMMKSEAIDGRKRMVRRGRSILRPDVGSDVEPPYSPAQIKETAMHEEILFIYHNARPETRACYDKGHDTAPIAPENWIVRWMLWHVFRYRDSRNRGRPRNGTSSQPSPGNDSDDSSGNQMPPSRGSRGDGVVASPPPSRSPYPYDPVRDR